MSKLEQYLAAVLLLLSSLHSISGGWVDPDTALKDRKIKSHTTGEIYDIVMSDEFNIDGRKFDDGSDPMWTAIDRSDDDQTASGRKSLQFYNSSYVTTRNGSLVIQTTTDDTKWKGWNPYTKKYETMSRHFSSGMVQGWNKFCFTGGILEVRLKFPGRSDIGGLWPAVWLLGNLGRATYEASTNLMWPWSYKECDRSLQHAQELSGCDITNHFSLNARQGRGATEIDIIEVMAGPSSKLPVVKNNVHRPYTSMTLQLAPGIPASKRRPFAGTLPEWGFTWYNNLTYGENVSINPFFYGTYLSQTSSNEPIPRSKLQSYQCDAVSSMVQLENDHFESFHTFRLEWQPGDDGYIHWYGDDEFKFGVEAEGLKITGAQIPREPSYIILNTAISTSWGFPNPPPGCNNYDCKDPEALCGFPAGFCKMLPAEFLIDYVRVYQPSYSSVNNHPKQPHGRSASHSKNSSSSSKNAVDDRLFTVGCNPKQFPTTRFIKGHEYRYKGLDQANALKDVVIGGGKCTIDEDCNGYSSNSGASTAQSNNNPAQKNFGRCRQKKCQCMKGWVGPNCKVPAYHNDEPDWDSDSPWIPLQQFYFTSFLKYTFLVVFLAILATTVVLFHQRRKKREEIQRLVASKEKELFLPHQNGKTGGYQSA